jgi:hypothetical protein
MYRVTLVCSGLTDNEGTAAVAGLLEEFSHRPWQANPKCEWKDGLLRLSATNDFDKDGAALLDEFGDAIHACVNYNGKISLKVESVASV